MTDVAVLNGGVGTLRSLGATAALRGPTEPDDRPAGAITRLPRLAPRRTTSKTRRPPTAHRTSCPALRCRTTRAPGCCAPAPSPAAHRHLPKRDWRTAPANTQDHAQSPDSDSRLGTHRIAAGQNGSVGDFKAIAPTSRPATRLTKHTLAAVGSGPYAGRTPTTLLTVQRLHRSGTPAACTTSRPRTFLFLTALRNLGSSRASSRVPGRSFPLSGTHGTGPPSITGQQPSGPVHHKSAPVPDQPRTGWGATLRSPRWCEACEEERTTSSVGRDHTVVGCRGELEVVEHREDWLPAHPYGVAVRDDVDPSLN